MNLFAATGNIHGNASPAATQSQPDQTETGGGVDETGGPAIHDLGMPHGRGSRESLATPGLVAPAWTLYALTADDVEFWQADHERRHIRLQYRRAADAWTRRLLWP